MVKNRKIFAISINRDIYFKLHDFLRNKYGSTYGYISKTIEEAIIFYMQNYKSEKEKIEELNKKLNELEKENQYLKIEISKINAPYTNNIDKKGLEKENKSLKGNANNSFFGKNDILNSKYVRKEEIEEAKKIIENLKKELKECKIRIEQIEKYKPIPIHDNFISKINEKETKNNGEDKLPSFLKGNPWLDILKNKGKEKEPLL